jgi:hypothetical protein
MTLERVERLAPVVKTLGSELSGQLGFAGAVQR